MRLTLIAVGIGPAHQAPWRFVEFPIARFIRSSIWLAATKRVRHKLANRYRDRCHGRHLFDTETHLCLPSPEKSANRYKSAMRSRSSSKRFVATRFASGSSPRAMCPSIAKNSTRKFRRSPTIPTRTESFGSVPVGAIIQRDLAHRVGERRHEEDACFAVALDHGEVLRAFELRVGGAHEIGRA